MKKKLIRTDSKAIIGSVILGILWLLISQASGAIDNMFFWGKAGMLILNGAVWAIATAVIVLTYKQPAGIIAGLVEGVTSMFYSPALWVFLTLANVAGALIYTLCDRLMAMDRMSHHFIAQIVNNYIGNAIVGVGLYVVYDLPANAAVLCSLITATAGWIISAPVTAAVMKKITKSGLADN